MTTSGFRGSLDLPTGRALVYALLLALAGSVLSACVRSTSSGDAIEAARKAEARASAVATLASRHGADAEWEKPFTTQRLGAYTYELQRALIKTDGRPVILTGALDDIIAVAGDQYEIRGRQSLPVGPTLYFSLRCGTDRISVLLGRTPELLDAIAEYAIAARIARISKPMFKGSAQFGTDDQVNVPEVVVEPGDIVIGAGECLEVVRLDDR